MYVFNGSERQEMGLLLSPVALKALEGSRENQNEVFRSRRCSLCSHCSPAVYQSLSPHSGFARGRDRWQDGEHREERQSLRRFSL